MSLHSQKMKCPVCRSAQINKNGHRGAKQSYRCKDCGRQFVESYSSRGYSSDAKQICLKLYHNGMGFRAIERATGVSHNTVINWVREEASTLPDAEHTETTELEALPELSEEAFYAAQSAETLLNKGTVFITHKLNFLRLAVGSSHHSVIVQCLQAS